MVVYERYNDKILHAYSDSNKELIELPSNAVYGDVYAYGHLENGVAVFDAGQTYIEGNEKPVEEEQTENNEIHD